MISNSFMLCVVIRDSRIIVRYRWIHHSVVVITRSEHQLFDAEQHDQAYNQYSLTIVSCCVMIDSLHKASKQALQTTSESFQA